MTITIDVIDFVKTAYQILKDETSENVSWHKFDDNGNIKYTIMKKSWYHGGWYLFDGSSKVCSFSIEYLESLQPKKEVKQ